MDTCPATPIEPESLATLREQSARHFHAMLMRMVEQGAALAELYAQQALDRAHAGTSEAGMPPDSLAAYNGLTRSVRRSVLLAQKLLEPAPVAKPVAPGRAEVRAAVIRKVEDAIGRDAPAAEAEGLRAELQERLEAPEFDDEIATRRVAEIIEEISRDLGAVSASERDFWQRRTPADVAALHALAAAPCRDSADGRPAVTRVARNAPADRAAPVDLAELAAALLRDAPPIRGP